MKKMAIGAALILGGVVVAVAAFNYVSLSAPLNQVIAADSRDAGISVSAHYAYYVDTSSVVFDLRQVSSTNSPMDVTRVLLQFAAAVKEKDFLDVTLLYSGNPKFRLKGDFFKTLGNEYAVQNPIYTIRTLPEHTYKLDGSPAFGTWTGGWLGVVGKEMEDFSELHKQWYINDLPSSAR